MRTEGHLRSGGFAATDTHKEIAAKHIVEMVKVIQSADFRRRMKEIGAEPNGNSSEQMAQQISAESEKFAKLVKEASGPSFINRRAQNLRRWTADASCRTRRFHMDLLTGLPRPTPTVLADARGSMTPAEAGHLVGITEAVWIGYETDFVMPMAIWALYLLATGQHPTATLDPRARHMSGLAPWNCRYP